MKKLIKESGIRDINALAKRYPKAEIYFHQDLDGVTTAIAMREYLENNGIKVVGAHVIQYGDKEFAIRESIYANNRYLSFFFLLTDTFLSFFFFKYIHL